MTNPQDEQLLPCPFCGGTNLKEGGDDKIVGTWCEDCEACGPNGYRTYPKRYTWQSRAPMPAEGRVESLDNIIRNWPDDADWKPVQTLSKIDDRMCFPVETILAKQKVKDWKDYILCDVVAAALKSTPSPSVEAGQTDSVDFYEIKRLLTHAEHLALNCAEFEEGMKELRRLYGFANDCRACLTRLQAALNQRGEA